MVGFGDTSGFEPSDGARLLGSPLLRTWNPIHNLSTSTLSFLPRSPVDSLDIHRRRRQVPRRRLIDHCDRTSGEVTWSEGRERVTGRFESLLMGGCVGVESLGRGRSHDGGQLKGSGCALPKPDIEVVMSHGVECRTHVDCSSVPNIVC